METWLVREAQLFTLNPTLADATLLTLPSPLVKRKERVQEPESDSWTTKPG